MNSTQPSSLPPPQTRRDDDSAALADARGAHWLAKAAMALSVLGLVAVAVAAVVPSSWLVTATDRRLGVQQPAPFALVPAQAAPVDRVISYDLASGDPTRYPPRGDFYYVTVSQPPQSALSWLVSRGDPTVKFVTYEDVYGHETPEQTRVVSRQQMATSEQRAQYVALNRLGMDVSLVPGDVIVGQIVCLKANEKGTDCVKYPPADELIDPGDTLIAVDGRTVDTLSALAKVLSTHKPGDSISVKVNRNGEEVSGMVQLVASPDDPSRPLIGFVPMDTTTVRLPFDVKFDTGRTGGPSAGLAFSLSLVDELSAGELTGGKRIAVTGTIDFDGSVGPIGGLVQKASAVSQTGVDTFIVPAAQGESDIAAARAAVGDRLDIVPVDTFDEALATLQRLGGDPPPKKPATAR